LGGSLPETVNTMERGTWNGLHWYAVYTRVQHEKIVAQALAVKGYEEFLPLCRCRRRWSDRIKDLELPLFPGYVFCRFDAEQRLPILVTPGVHHIVGIGKIPLPVEEAEIAAIQSIVRTGLPTEPWPFLQVRQRVRIDSGPLEGLLLAVKKPYRLVVSVTLLQRSVAVEIDSVWVTPLALPQRPRSPQTSQRRVQSKVTDRGGASQPWPERPA
jgi:transcription antitermination factor NusG